MSPEENNGVTEEVATVTQDGADTTSSLTSIIQLERIKKQRLMRSLARLSLMFGATIIASMAVTWTAAYSASPGIIVFGMLTGTLMIAVALVISSTYGFSKKNIVPGNWSANDVWFRMNNHDEILKSLPRVYLAMSGVILLCCGGCMIAGDVVLGQYSHNEVSYPTTGRPYVFLGCSTIFIASATLSFVLTFLIFKNHLRIIATCFVLVNFTGFVVAMLLNFGLYYGPRAVDMVDINQRRSALNQGRIDLRQTLENNIALGIMLKFASVEIALVFSLFNALLALTFLADSPHKKMTVGKSMLMGILGAVLIISAIAMEVIIDIFCTSLVLRFSYMLRINRSLFVLFCLLTGLQSLHAFHSAGNLHKLTVFALSSIVVIFSAMTMISIVDFRGVQIATESAALSDCQGNTDSNLFCVYNTTGLYDDYYENVDGVIYQTVYHGDPYSPVTKTEEKKLQVACIPKEKYCDGKADLFINTTSGGFRRGRLQLCGSFLDKSSWYMYRVDPLVPIDEVSCYSNTPLSWLVIAALIILSIDIVCAIILMIITCKSLQPGVSVVFNYFKKLFGVVSPDELPSKTVNPEETNIERTNTDAEPLYT